MKRKIIFGTIAIIGLMIAICVTDNSKHELLVRLIGIALFFTGSLLSGWFDNNDKSHHHGNSTK